MLANSDTLVVRECRATAIDACYRAPALALDAVDARALFRAATPLPDAKVLRRAALGITWDTFRVDAAACAA